VSFFFAFNRCLSWKAWLLAVIILAMLKVEDMSHAEMHGLLERQHFGHLGCARDNRPYVVPMNYAYDGRDFYFFTTQGMKTRFIDTNPEVCLQVEEVNDSTHWSSVMVTGKAEQITSNEEMQKAMSLITQRNPSLTPAISATSVDAWGRGVDVAVYRITPEIVDGRKTVS
jgi:nitroimidazol reductase NimA-like FMN-containing flavoprotein (pyridoxamine 5'-phosphate oxidase superfamily)